MRRKLLLTIGLGSSGACVIAGTAARRRRRRGRRGAASRSSFPTAATSGQVPALPQCSNLADDDGDGVIDLDDPDCSGPLDSTESGTAGPPPEQPPTTPEPPTAPQDGEDGTETEEPEQKPDRKPDGVVGGPAGPGGRGAAASPAATASPAAAAMTTERRRRAPPRRAGDRWHQRRSQADGRAEPTATPTAPPPTPTRASPSPTSARPRSGSRTSSSTSSRSRPSCCRSTRPAGPSTGSRGRCSPRSTGSRPPSAPTSMSPPPAPSAGCSSCPRPGTPYGVDANDDGRKDPYNPVDAICAAARYLKAAGGAEDLRTAIFAYNHADWYVDEVLLYANQYGRLPDDLVGSLTGLTEGARFPVAANARYADDISERQALKRSKPGQGAAGNVADVISGSPTRRGINIYSREGAPVVAVNDGVITRIGKSKELGRYIVLRDAYGNRFTYAELGEVAEAYPVPKPERLSAEDFELVTPDDDAARRAGERRDPGRRREGRGSRAAPSATPSPPSGRPGQHRGLPRPPLRLPRAQAQRRPRRPHGPARLAARRADARLRVVQGLPRRRPALRPEDDGPASRCRRARRSTAGTVLGRIGEDRRARPAPALRDPPGRAAARRRSTRSRSSTAGSCSRRPRSTAPPGKNPFDGTAPAPARCC